MAKGRSRLREVVRGRTEELEAPAVEVYARGLSTRDIEALFANESGGGLLSRAAVSEITERLWAECEASAASTCKPTPMSSSSASTGAGHATSPSHRSSASAPSCPR